MVCQQAVAIPETNRRNFPGSGSAFGSSIAITFSPSQMVDHRTRTDCRTRAGQSSRARRPRVQVCPCGKLLHLRDRRSIAVGGADRRVGSAGRTQERQTGGGVDKLADRSGNCPVRRLAPGPYPQPLTPSPGATSLAQAKRPIRSTEGTRPALGEFIFAQEKTVLNALCAYG